MLDFSASRLAERLTLDQVAERDFEEIRNSIQEDSPRVGKLQRIELLLFSSILLIHLNLAKEVSLAGFNVSASENLLAILILIFSTVQIGVAIAVTSRVIVWSLPE
jgi:hypothetical protein